MDIVERKPENRIVSIIDWLGVGLNIQEVCKLKNVKPTYIYIYIYIYTKYNNVEII